MKPDSNKQRFASVPLHVLFLMSWRNLSTKKLRSFLTILGVIIGIGAIFFLLSLGLGLQNLVTKEVVGNKSIRSVDISSPNSRIIQLDDQHLDKISNLSQVGKLGSSYSFAGSITLNNSEVDTITYGIDIDYQELSNLQVVKGQLLEANEYGGVLVNTALLDAMGIDNADKAIDQKVGLRIPLRLADDSELDFIRDFKVVGVINSGSGSEVFLPGILLNQAGATQYSQAKLLAKDEADISALRKQIESLGFETTSPMDTIDEINQIFKYFNVVLVGFGGIGMIVAVLGMFNTLSISLLERTKEIGLMLSLGARRKDMRFLFVLEAVLLSVIGSVVGIVMAIMGGWIMTMLMNNLADRRGVSGGFMLFATPLWLVVALILFMVAVGVLVVLLPARRAEKINPIDILRRE